MLKALKQALQRIMARRPAEAPPDSGPPIRDDDIPSAPDKPDGGSGPSSDEMLVRLVERSLEHLRTHGFGEEGKDGFLVAFDVPGTDHEGMLRLAVEHRPDRELWRFSVGVHQTGSRRLHSHFLCHGDGQEGKDKIAAYLARPEVKMELAASVKELSDHVDRDD